MPRRGSTLLKLLVVFAVIAILIGLLLPAVAKVRAAAARSNSMNNLKQLALGGLNYHDSMGKYPNMVAEPNGIPKGPGTGPAFYEMLPYLEQDNVMRRFEAKEPKSFYDTTTGIAQIHIPLFISPTDPSGPQALTTEIEVSAPDANEPFPKKFTGKYAASSYSGNGLIFAPNMKIAQIRDGTSNTLFFAERHQACQYSDKPGDVVYNLWAMGAYSASTPSFALALPNGDNYPRTSTHELKQFVPPKEVPQNGAVKGRSGRDTVEFSVIAKAANAPAGFQVMPRPGTCDPRIPQSSQQNGMFGCFCDGSVRMLTQNKSANIFWALTTPQGSEVVQAD